MNIIKGNILPTPWNEKFEILPKNIYDKFDHDQLSRLTIISLRENPPTTTDIYREIQPSMDTMAQLKNAIFGLWDLDYTPHSELGKSFRLLKSIPIPLDHA